MNEAPPNDSPVAREIEIAALTDAMFYASRGWPVLPLRPGTKAPDGRLARHGFKSAVTNPATIRSWWERSPTAGVGIATGAGLIVLDVDPRNGGDQSLRRLVDRFGPLPVTPYVRTGGGGTHSYFVGDAKSRSSFAPGLDLKGRRGFVVAPRSIHPSGVTYVWLVDPTDVPLAPAPEWILEDVSTDRPFQTRPSGPTTPPESQGEGVRIAEGYRHNHMLWKAGKLRHEGFGFGEILSELIPLNQKICDPPLMEEELEQIAEWVSQQPSFGEQYELLRLAWALPSGSDRRSMTEWKVKQALLRIAWNCQSTSVAPGIRRLALEAKVADKTAQSVVESLRTRRELVPSQGPWLVGRAKSYRLRLVKGAEELVTPPPPGAGNVRPLPQLDGSSSPPPKKLRRLTPEEMHWLMLRFRGHEGALLLLNELMAPRTATELSVRTTLSRSAVYDNLNWLERQGMVRKLGHTWVFNTSPGVVVPSVPAEQAERWARVRDRYARERDQYDEYFRSRYGIDRQTGEILDER